MKDMIEDAALALQQRFKNVVSASAKKPFEETKVEVPQLAVFKDYAETISNVIWNAAIEAAAKVGSEKANECCYRSDGWSEYVGDEIRKLKR